MALARLHMLMHLLTVCVFKNRGRRCSLLEVLILVLLSKELRAPLDFANLIRRPGELRLAIEVDTIQSACLLLCNTKTFDRFLFRFLTKRGLLATLSLKNRGLEL